MYTFLGLKQHPECQRFYLDMKTQYLILGYFCAHLQKPTKAKISGKKIPPGLIHQHETKKVVEQNDLAIRESILLKRTKKLTTKTLESWTLPNKKIKEEILTRPIKIKKGCWSTSLPDFTYVLCTLMTAIRWTSEPSHQFLWRQVTGWCGRQQHRNAHCPLKFDTNGIENDFPWWIYFEWSCPIIEVLIMKSLIY